MSHGYVAVQWNRFKRFYDLTLWAGILLYIAIFVAVSGGAVSGAEALSPMILIIRALATCAFVLLTLILCIGPLARLHSAFLPLLYNRRHLGVSMFVIALTHAVLALIWYHSFGVENPIASIFTSPGGFAVISDFPFQVFGALALIVLLLLAATSHDYWNTNLGAPVWKALHMSVYVAYALVVVHVATGAMQNPNTGIGPVFVLSSVVLVGGLHGLAAWRSRRADHRGTATDWISLGPWRDIPDGAAIVATVPGAERVAVFRYEHNKLAAVSNVCKHQNGPLGEGRIIDGCITCPWHGFQYRPEDGRAPAPFNERISTYRLRLDGEELLLDPEPLPEGTERPVLIAETAL